MAESILTAVAYIICFVFIIACIELVVALFQILEDVPMLRKRLWLKQNRDFKKYSEDR